MCTGFGRKWLFVTLAHAADNVCAKALCLLSSWRKIMKPWKCFQAPPGWLSSLRSHSIHLARDTQRLNPTCLCNSHLAEVMLQLCQWGLFKHKRVPPQMSLCPSAVASSLQLDRGSRSVPTINSKSGQCYLLQPGEASILLLMVTSSSSRDLLLSLGPAPCAFPEETGARGSALYL